MKDPMTALLPMDLSSPSPDHLGGDAATVTSSEGGVSRSSSEVAVAHDSPHKKTSHHPHHPPDAIPKAITLTTTVMRTTTPLLTLTTDLLHQQLQKRLRPEDIPSIPSSLRNQRRRVHYQQQQQQQHMVLTTTTSLATCPRSDHHQYRPVCNFVNYLGHHHHYHTSRTRMVPPPPPRDDWTMHHHYPDRFSTSLISLHDHDDHDVRTTTTIGHDPTTPQFASIVTVDDDDMLRWSSSTSSSHWDGGEWGLLLPIVGMEVGMDDDDDVVGFRPWDDQTVTTHPVQHLDDEDGHDTAFLDPFTLPYGHGDDDATDLFDFD